jgi:hypothetical protein
MTDPNAPGDAAAGRAMTRLVIVCLTGLSGMLCLVAGGVLMTGNSVSGLMQVVTIVAAPIIVTLLAYVGASLTASLSYVRQQTNGNMAAMLAQLGEQSRMLAAMVPAHPDAPTAAAATEQEGIAA